MVFGESMASAVTLSLTQAGSYMKIGSLDVMFVQTVEVLDLKLGAGNDNITAGDGDDTLQGWGGKDILRGGGGDDLLDGGDGADQLIGGTGDDTYFVTAGDIVTEADGEGTDRLSTPDSFSAAGQHIEVLSLYGPFDVNLTANHLNNEIRDNAGDNIIYASGGDDIIWSGAGYDTLHGSSGNDTFYVQGMADVVVEFSSGGLNDRIFTSRDFTLADNCYVEVLSDLNAAATVLNGNKHAQAIIGAGGADTIDGRGGSDTLTGGGGEDIFEFTRALGPTNVDTITDFSAADDTIRLENFIFTQIVGIGTLSANQFRANATGQAQDADDRIIYETDSGRVFYDSNGNAAGGNFLFADLESGLAITNADFLIA